MNRPNIFTDPPNNRFIITGGPGSGKTTLIEKLQSKGYAGFPEIARQLISQGIAPSFSPDKRVSSQFFDIILSQRILQHQQIGAAEIAFFDRGIPDSLAYFNYHKKKAPDILLEALKNYPYNQHVFVAPPWEEIYFSDAIRTETFSEAQKLYEIITEAYKSLGYLLVELPKSTLESRLSAVLEIVENRLQ